MMLWVHTVFERMICLCFLQKTTLNYFKYLTIFDLRQTISDFSYYLWFFILSLIFHTISDFSCYLWFFTLSLIFTISLIFYTISVFWLKTIYVLPVCVDCNKLLPQGCSVHNTEYEYMPDSPFLTRARATLPKCFTLQQTSTSEFKNLMGEFNVLFMYNQC